MVIETLRIMLSDTETTIPFAWVAAVLVPMAASVVFVFKMLLVSQEKRVAEMAAVHAKAAEATERMTEEIRAQWRALDRMSKVTGLRMVANSHIAPQFRDEAKEILSGIEQEEKDADRREKP